MKHINNSQTSDGSALTKIVSNQIRDEVPCTEKKSPLKDNSLPSKSFDLQYTEIHSNNG